MSPDTFYFHRNGVSRYFNVTLFKPEVRKLSVDFSAYCGSKSTSLSSAAFTAEFSSAVSVSGNANASNVASCLLTGVDEGNEYVTCSATLANGETVAIKFWVDCDDPRTNRYPSFDYAS